MAVAIALVVGLLSGAGFIASGMASPTRVLGFLDLFGQRDPSPALVMAGAITVGVIAFLVACRRGRSWPGTPIQLPPAIGVTVRLVLGNVVFGIGWGLAGLCPGSASATLGAGVPKAVGFVATMLAGTAVFSWLQCRR